MGFWQRLLNLPDREAGETMLHRAPKGSTAAAPAPTAAGHRWEAAAPPPPRPADQPSAVEDERPADVAPWEAGHVVRPPSKVWPTILRAVALGAACLVMLSGIRTIFFPRKIEVPPAVLPAAALFPESAASGFALRVAAAYGSWDEATPEQRTTALAAVGGGGLESTWDGRGRQTFANLSIGHVTAEIPTRGAVTVVGTLTPWVSDRDTWRPDNARARTVGLHVPVVVDARGVVGLSGAPTWVAAPLPAALPQPRPITDVDSAVTEETGNIFIIVLAVRMLGHYAKREWGEMVASLIGAIIVAFIVYANDAAVALLKRVGEMIFR